MSTRPFLCCEESMGDDQPVIIILFNLSFLCDPFRGASMSQDEIFDDLAERIKHMQIKAREIAQKRSPSATLKRGFHDR